MKTRERSLSAQAAFTPCGGSTPEKSAELSTGGDRGETFTPSSGSEGSLLYDSSALRLMGGKNTGSPSLPPCARETAPAPTLVTSPMEGAVTGNPPGRGMNPELQIFGDTNRDGKLSETDVKNRREWRWNGPGAFFLANVDDDDRDGRPDGADTRVNGPADETDLAPLKVRIGPNALREGRTVHVTPWESPAPGVHIYQRTEKGWRLVDGPLEGIAPEMDLAIEGSAFASKSWDGFVTLKLEVKGEDGRSLGYDLARLRVAPFILLPNAADTKELYVSAGHPNYENGAFRAGLASAAADTGVKMVTHKTSSWKEMWMQDTMEIGYTQIPGGAPQYVVLGGLRNADSFGATLFGPDRGYIKVGAYRGIANGVDDWADWMGNLEVSPPVPGYPLGRAIYGRNTDTGVTLHPEVVSFLEAQKVQAPFWIDTGFLTIKHVDEIVTFIPGPDDKPRMLIADTHAATVLVPEEVGRQISATRPGSTRFSTGGATPAVNQHGAFWLSSGCRRARLCVCLSPTRAATTSGPTPSIPSISMGPW